eukprot:m.69519 g.69519  ORF g.69519 m.69519 type:complete len:74 (-) comp12226_c0_seq2:58-279(-)
MEERGGEAVTFSAATDNNSSVTVSEKAFILLRCVPPLSVLQLKKKRVARTGELQVCPRCAQMSPVSYTVSTTC